MLVLFISNKSEMIVGKWDIVNITAIDMIRNSDGYLLADFATQSLADQKFQLALDSTVYEFRKDTLYYTDIDGVNIIHRRALWKLIGDTIYVKEIDRNFFREYLVRDVTSDTLIFSSILNGKPAKARYIFSKNGK
ncbi:hypothetical protein [Algoriphagus winogradskyi]|uniref:hypothetical protein n=1 Tax=Algoriphagus winogradskyi TaxID=237017 RepID=UPI0024B74369|nr:hypothetical protein [Algoriphagus winogradskyi]